MAVSGAAASSNMGANSIKPLTPTLAILNVRLGYWVANPRRLAPNGKPRSMLVSLFISVFEQLYFLQELFGLMRENTEIVYPPTAVTSRISASTSCSGAAAA